MLKTWGIFACLGLYLFTWVLSHSISDTNLDPYGDMLENFIWGQTFSWGTFKHPPVISWVTGAWFWLMPDGDIPYHLLAYLNAAVGLYAVYRLAGAFGLSQHALPAALLLSLALPYSTLAIKFNANSVLLAIWPWIVLAWLRAVQRTSLPWSLLLGVLAAVGVLAKYFTGVLLLSLLLTSLISPTARRWLTGSGPWLAFIVFVILLIPHLFWVMANDFVTFGYVMAQGDGGMDLGQNLKFVAAPLVYWLIAWIACVWAYAIPGSSFLANMKRAGRCWQPRGRDDLLFWMAVFPWAFTLAIGFTGFVTLSLPWAIPIGFAYTLLWVRNLTEPVEETESDMDGVARDGVARDGVARDGVAQDGVARDGVAQDGVAQDGVAQDRVLARCRRAFLIWLGLALGISPIYAWQQSTSGEDNFYLPRKEAANAILSELKQNYPDESFGWAGGDWAEAGLLSFYGDDELFILPGLPDTHPATVTPLHGWQQQGGVLLCRQGYVDKPRPSDCAATMTRWLADRGQNNPPLTITVRKSGLRFTLDRPFTYQVFVYLPPGGRG